MHTQSMDSTFYNFCYEGTPARYHLLPEQGSSSSSSSRDGLIRPLPVKSLTLTGDNNMLVIFRYTIIYR